jgi:hypothetical protein
MGLFGGKRSEWVYSAQTFQKKKTTINTTPAKILTKND